MPGKTASKQLRYRYPKPIPFLLAIVGMWLITDISFVHNGEFDVRPGTSPAVAFYQTTILQNTYNLAVIIFGSLNGLRIVTVAAHMAHVAESTYAAYICMRYNAGFFLTLQYTFMTFLGGYTQLGPLKAAVQKAFGNTA